MSKINEENWSNTEIVNEKHEVFNNIVCNDEHTEESTQEQHSNAQSKRNYHYAVTPASLVCVEDDTVLRRLSESRLGSNEHSSLGISKTVTAYYKASSRPNSASIMRSADTYVFESNYADITLAKGIDQELRAASQHICRSKNFKLNNESVNVNSHNELSHHNTEHSAQCLYDKGFTSHNKHDNENDVRVDCPYDNFFSYDAQGRRKRLIEQREFYQGKRVQWSKLLDEQKVLIEATKPK